MARYKRTARAEVRRRHREQARAQAETVVGDGAARDATATPRPGAAPAHPDKPRSFIASALSGFALPDVRADIRALPRIALRTWTFAAPLALIAAAFAGALDARVFRLEETPGEPPTAFVARILLQYMLNPVPVMAIFIAGFLAPKANWLVGGIIGVAAAGAFFVLLAIHGPTPEFPIQATPATAAEAIALYLPLYILLGGFSGWYRRWLTSRQQRARQQAAERRRTHGRDTRRSRAAAARRS